MISRFINRVRVRLLDRLLGDDVVFIPESTEVGRTPYFGVVKFDTGGAELTVFLDSGVMDALATHAREAADALEREDADDALLRALAGEDGIAGGEVDLEDMT